MPDDPKDPAPVAAQPAYTIAKQKHGRWWEVRDPAAELVCSPCTGRVRERWCDAWLPDGYESA